MLQKIKWIRWSRKVTDKKLCLKGNGSGENYTPTNISTIQAL